MPKFTTLCTLLVVYTSNMAAFRLLFETEWRHCCPMHICSDTSSYCNLKVRKSLVNVDV